MAMAVGLLLFEHSAWHLGPLAAAGLGHESRPELGNEEGKKRCS